MTAKSRNEFLKEMIDWTEDEFYWYEVVEKDTEKITFTVHKMRIKKPQKRKKIVLKQSELNEI